MNTVRLNLKWTRSVVTGLCLFLSFLMAENLAPRECPRANHFSLSYLPFGREQIGLATFRNADTGTLILIAVAKGSIVVAADSAMFNEGQPMKHTAHKILPVGKFGVCMFNGATALQKLTNGSVSDEERFTIIAEKWIKTHPAGTVRDAYVSIESEIFDSMTAFQKRHPEFSGDPVHSFSSFACVGYDMGKPLVLVTDFVAPATPGQEIKRRPDRHFLTPGFLVALGRDAISLEVTKNNSSTHFSKFKDEPAVKKYRDAISAKKPDLINRQDFLAIFRTCLEATESAEGRAFDPLAYQVERPNYFAVIDRTNGFNWVRK